MNRLVALLLVSLVGFCKRTPPVVGFQSDAAVALTHATDAADDGPADAGHFAVIEGRPVTGRALVVDGVTLAPPAGTSFGVWLPVDLDGDGQSTDVAATVTGGDHLARTAMVFRRDEAGLTRVAMADVLPTDARCAEATLRLTSPRSMVVGWRCPTTAADAGAPVGLVMEEALVALGTAPAVRERAGLRAPQPTDGEITLALEGTDRDGDGVDEVVVNVLAGARRASVRAVYFARPGGLARDTSEPAASFAALIERARRGVSARRRSTLATALGSFDDVARLRRAACQGSDGLRLDLHGAGIPCEGVSWSAAAEGTARALQAGGELPAAWALTRAETASGWGVVSAPRVLAELRRATTPERGAVARRGPSIGSAPSQGRMSARLSALSFDTPVNPTAINVRGVVSGTIDLAGLTFMPGGGGTEADLVARSPDGSTAIVGFAETCRGLAAVRCPASDDGCVALSMRPSGGAVPASAATVALGSVVSGALAGRCVGDAGATAWLGATPRASLFAWTPSGATLVVGDRVATVTESAVAWGDAAGVAIARPEGVWVRDRSGWKLLAPPELAGRYGDLTDLAATSDGRAVAALLGAEVWVIERARAAGH